MTLETKKSQNDKASDVWETILERRLTGELDAFLEESDDATFLFADRPIASRRIGRIDKRPRFNMLATIAAGFALLVVGAATARFYIVSPLGENNARTRQANDETSLIAWSVENLSETEWARQVENRWASADVFELYASLETEAEAAEEACFAVGENGNDKEGKTSETVLNEWFSAEKLADVAARGPLKYEPFLQAVAALL